MLAAMLPSTMFIDHWSEYVGTAFGQHDFVATDHVGHEVHCHGSPASCSLQTAPINAQMFASVVEVPQPTLTDVSLEYTVADLDEYLVSPPTEPPRL